LSKLGKYIKRSSWLKEIWNQTNSNIDGSTFPLKEPKYKIDYIYISQELINSTTQVAKSTMQTEIGEDHCSLWGTIAPSFLQRSKDFKGISKVPKLNTRYASKETWEEYTKEIEEYIKNNKVWPESNITLEEVIYNTGKKFFKTNIRKDKKDKNYIVLTNIKYLRKKLTYIISRLSGLKKKLMKVIDQIIEEYKDIITEDLKKDIKYIKYKDNVTQEEIKRLRTIGHLIARKLRIKIINEATYELMKKIQKAIRRRNDKMEFNIGSILKNLKRGPLELNIGISRYYNNKNNYITTEPQEVINKVIEYNTDYFKEKMN